MVQKYMFSIFITILISQSNSSPTRTTLIDGEVQEIRSLCNDQNDPLSCLKFKAMNFLQTIFQQDSFKLSNDVEIRKNGLEDFNLSGRAETDTLDKIESFIQSHDVTVNIPFTGSKVTVSPRNIKENELLVNVKLPENNHNIGDARKSKLKKIAIPLMVFVLLKAMTLIPLALGVLGLKAWNALQLSFFSFVISVALAIFQLCKKIATDNHHPHITHAPWEAARLLTEKEPNTAAQNVAYNAYT